METQLSSKSLALSHTDSITTILGIIQAFEKAAPHNGLFVKKNKTINYNFISYRKMAAKIAAYMASYQDFGISQGTRILFPFETTEETIFAFFSLIGIGGIPLLIKPYGLGISQNSYLGFLSKITSQHQVNFILETSSIKSLDLKCELRKLPLLSFDNQQNNQQNIKKYFARLKPSDTAFVQFSSGSTSFPKGIPITHKNLISQLKIISNHFRGTKEDITAIWLPLYHDMDLVGGFLTPLYLGHNLHLTTPIDFLLNPIEWLNYLSQHRVTITAIPDFAINYILKQLKNINISDFLNFNLDNLRVIYNGSEPINSDNLKKFITLFESHGLKPETIKPCYGMAEAVLMVASIPLKDSPRIKIIQNGRKVTSVGQLMPSFNIRLVNDNGQICQEGEIGEIELKNGTLTEKYFEKCCSFYNKDGFFSTGDLGFIDRGELFICGRVQERFKFNGQSFFASDFEHIIHSLPFMEFGNVVVIQPDISLVVLIELKRVNITQAKLYYQQQVSEIILQQMGIKIPVQNVLIIESRQLKKTSSGKLRRKAIAESYQKGEIKLLKIT